MPVRGRVGEGSARSLNRFSAAKLGCFVTERKLLLHRAPRAELTARVLPPNMPSTNPSVAFETDLSELLGPALASALATKGYTTLTPVQKAVLDPALAGRDLRLSSQTGSGKTLAIGFVLRAALEAAASPVGPVARPRALVIAPTRELAKQVEMELSWLYAPLKVAVVSVTGGANYRD